MALCLRAWWRAQDTVLIVTNHWMEPKRTAWWEVAASYHIAKPGGYHCWVAKYWAEPVAHHPCVVRARALPYHAALGRVPCLFFCWLVPPSPALLLLRPFGGAMPSRCTRLSRRKTAVGTPLPPRKTLCFEFFFYVAAINPFSGCGRRLSVNDLCR